MPLTRDTSTRATVSSASFASAAGEPRDVTVPAISASTRAVARMEWRGNRPQGAPLRSCLGLPRADMETPSPPHPNLNPTRLIGRASQPRRYPSGRIVLCQGRASPWGRSCVCLSGLSLCWVDFVGFFGGWGVGGVLWSPFRLAGPLAGRVSVLARVEGVAGMNHALGGSVDGERARTTVVTSASWQSG